MSAIQRLFGRDDKFFDLLDSSANQANQAAELLERYLAESSSEEKATMLGDVNQHRRKHKRVSQEITEQLFKVFVTPIEREDIGALSSALYKITKTVEKIAERLNISPSQLSLQPLGAQVALLKQGTNILVKMVAELRKKHQGELINDSYEQIQAIEGDADRVMNDLLRKLYQDEVDARKVVFLKDIYELLEKGVDRCRDAAAVLFHIVLKNS